MTSFEIGYVAGILDGEGTISVSYSQSRHARQPTLSARVSVGSTHRGVLDWLRSLFGGNVYEHKGNQVHTRAKTYWTWVVQGRPAMDVVTLAEPHLRIKREQAVLMREVAALLLPRTGDNRLRVVSDELRGRREVLVSEFRRLNAKGAS